MKNITLLKAKVGILAVSCLSITTLFACVDKDARSDLSPNLPTDQAQNGDFGDQGGGSDQGLNFPVFDDGVLAFPGIHCRCTGRKWCGKDHTASYDAWNV